MKNGAKLGPKIGRELLKGWEFMYCIDIDIDVATCKETVHAPSVQHMLTGLDHI